MDAQPILAMLARVLHEHGLEAVLIGNAAAALHGAPVTTLDFDFFFRKTPRNLRKLKAVAKSLDAMIFKPYYPIAELLRLSRDADSLQVDFMSTIHGVRSLASLRSRAKRLEFGGHPLLVADLEDMIRSKRAAGRERDASMKKRVTRQQKLDALKRETDRALTEQIRRLLRLPPEQRTHFLRKRIGYTATCL